MKHNNCYSYTIITQSLIAFGNDYFFQNFVFPYVPVSWLFYKHPHQHVITINRILNETECGLSNNFLGQVLSSLIHLKLNSLNVNVKAEPSPPGRLPWHKVLSPALYQREFT